MEGHVSDNAFELGSSNKIYLRKFDSDVKKFYTHM